MTPPTNPSPPERTPEPVAPELPETLEHQQLLAGINLVRARIVACGPRYGVTGIVSVRITISPQGRVTAFYPRQNAARSVDFTGCIGNALATVEFPHSQRGLQAVLPFNMGEGPPTPAAASTTPGPPTTAPLPEPRDPSVKTWFEKAHTAAVAGRCGTVKAFAHAVRDKEPEYYARVFSADVAIAACLK